VVLPALAEGAARSGRARAAIDLVGAPFLVTARDADGLAKARAAAKQHIAFYATSAGYRPVLDHHGWGGLAVELSDLAARGRWAEMAGLVSDDLLDEWAIVATWDELAAAVSARCGELFDTVLLDLPPELAGEGERVAALVTALRS
jgi:alkanesulfonate monooxygenase SsuD/methylene tetrahydromethanopterin reductase-like flavin-dependent oxidoreductase (luciferase family)